MNFPLDSVTEMSDEHKAMLSAQLEAMQVSLPSAPLTHPSLSLMAASNGLSGVMRFLAFALGAR